MSANIELSSSSLEARCKAAGLGTEVLAGTEALSTVSAHAKVDYVMAGIVGAAGLLPNLAAAPKFRRVSVRQLGPDLLTEFERACSPAS